MQFFVMIQISHIFVLRRVCFLFDFWFCISVLQFIYGFLNSLFQLVVYNVMLEKFAQGLLQGYLINDLEGKRTAEQGYDHLVNRQPRNGIELGHCLLSAHTHMCSYRFPRIVEISSQRCFFMNICAFTAQYYYVCFIVILFSLSSLVVRYLLLHKER